MTANGPVSPGRRLPGAGLPGGAAVGVDVGGTKILAVVVDPDEPSTVLAEARTPTPGSRADLVAAIADLVVSLCGDAAVAPVAIGIGFPGLVARDGTVLVAPHLDAAGLELEARVSAATGLPTFADNDVNCHARAEQRAGAARGHDEVLVLALGTGIGGGVVSSGRLVRGGSGFAGEPGHMVVSPGGVPCPCGRRGCWERYASGSALTRLAREAADAGRIRSVVVRAGGEPGCVRGEHVGDAAREGDVGALEVVAELAGWLGLGLTNLVNLLDPGLVVLGGGLAEMADLFLARVRADVAAGALGGPALSCGAGRGGRAG